MLAALAAGIALAVAGTAAAPPGPAAAAPPEESVVFTVGTTAEVDSINPMLSVLSLSLRFTDYLFDSVTERSSEDLSAIPGLASSWEGSPDGLTWTYHFRTGLTWSDGAPLTAEDAAYTYGRILKGGPGQGTWGNYLESVRSVEATDPATLVLRLDQPNALLPRLTVPVMPKHILEQYADDDLDRYPLDPETIVTSGPFRLLEGSPGAATYRFAANPENWRGAPPMDILTYRFFKAEDTVMQALIKGDIDYTSNVTPLQAKVLAKIPGVTANVFPELGTIRELGFNTGSVDLETGAPLGDPNPAVLDPAFRIALTTAVDRAAIAAKAHKGAAFPLTSVIGAGFDQFRWEPAAAETAFNPELAAERLDAAGYRLDAAGRRTLPDGSPMGELRLFVQSSDQTSVQTGQLLREWFDDLGLTLQITAMREAKLNDVVASGTYDMFEWGWSIDDDPDSILMYFACNQRGLWSDSWFCTSEYDALYAAQKREVDPEQRIERIQEIQRYLFREAPYQVLVGQHTQEAYRTDRFHGFQPALGMDGNVLFDENAYYHLIPGPEPGSGGAGGSSASRGNTALILGSLLAATLVVLGGRALLAARRRATAEETE
ncbi:ABC transporter substrate-binding protein [Leucobacter sp. M11]|uniref:ABC transporter substrate-binding protein n=1 Tax=Leucobacter sp. M11 TaxID=2993565 RepID=UPI002D7F02D2|nr:ABC transporter substrate-binding protein [Leucobacter sp. M11]MEB4613407.1 ABC transporter substrate-binding protein [Leucobacter sp. M11]